ncbi:hypothetical protein E2U79_08460 [Salmonella enterica]|nr:hypothetical protein [Salmonella enterica]ELW4385361.1 hypothetical protein [Salmonella enterica]
MSGKKQSKKKTHIPYYSLPKKPEEVLAMKKLTVSLCCSPLLLFSCLTCAMVPHNTADIIRQNTQNTAPHPSISVAESTPYLMTLDNNDRGVIPAGKTLIMPENNARNIITHMVNYSGVTEARKIKKAGDTFILE